MKIFHYINRHDLIYKWLENADVLLDIGCASGEQSNLFSGKCNKVCAIDPNENLLRTAKKKYPHINFKIGCAEEIPFKNETFDLVVMSDVLEHVENERKSLDEAYRVLKENGALILTAPNKGLFNFMDIDNYSWLFRKIFRIKSEKPGYQNKHKHYSLKEIKKLFGNKFEILKLYRSSFFLSPLISNLRLLIRHTFGEGLELRIKPYLDNISELDYSIPYGRFSYNIGIYAKKI